MKKTILSIALTALFTFGALAQESKSVKTSTVEWKGHKVTGSHYGTVNLSEGNLIFNVDTLSGGSFTVDMTSLTSTDLEGEWKEKLDGHLKSDDFFGVESHPSASLVFTSVTASSKNSYDVTADLTIKGITNPINFTLGVYGNKANATLKIDRAQYDIKYGSGSFFDNLGDKAIYDEFDLVVDLEF